MFFIDFFSSEELQFIKYIFGIPKSTENSHIPQHILNILPNENTKILSSLFAKPSDIIENLSLRYEDRVPLIVEISSLLKGQLTNEEFEYYSLIIIQSATCLLFKSFKEIDPKLFYNILSSLNIALKNQKVSTNKKEQFMGMILNHLQGCQITEYLPGITNIFINHPKLIDYCVPKCFELTKSVLVAKKGNLSADDQLTIALFIMQYSDHLAVYVGKKDMFQSIQLVMSVLQDKGINEREFEIALFNLLINLMAFSPSVRILFNAIDIFAKQPNIFQFSGFNSTNQFNDIPKTLIMGFHNVPETEEEPEVIQFKPFTQVNHIFNHPIVSIARLIISNKIFKMKNVFYKMIQEGLERISQGQLHYIIIIFIFVSQKSFYQSYILDFLTKENLWGELINPILFNNEENFINTPESDRIVLRQTLFNTVDLLIKTDNSHIPGAREALLNILRKHVQDSRLFSEILLMTFPMLKEIYEYPDSDDDLFDVLYQAAVIQQHRHIFGDSLSGRYRVNTFTVISYLLHQKEAVIMVQKSSYACQALCSSLFENVYYQTCASSLSSVLSHLSTDETFANITNAIHLLFLALLPLVTKPDGYKLFKNIINLLNKIIKENSVVVSSVILNSPILSDILACAIKINPTKETKELFDSILLLLFFLEYSTDFNASIVPYQALGSQLNTIGIDDTTYQLILRNISCTNDSFNRISQPAAMQLLLYAVKGTERYKEILEIILQLCEKSICNRCGCLVGGVVNFIFDSYDDETYELTLRIFEVISSTICSKSSLFAFIRHFSKLEAESMNKRLLSSLSCLTRILKKTDNPLHFGLIQLTSPVSFIRLPDYTVAELTKGMIIDFEVLFDSLSGERTLIEFGNGTIKFEISIKDNRIRIGAYGDNKGNSISIKLPIGEFFRFTIVLVLNHFVSFFVDERFVKGMPVMDINVPPSTVFNCNLIFKSAGANSIQMQLKSFLIKMLEYSPRDLSDIPKNIPTRQSVYFSGSSFSKGRLLMKVNKENKFVNMKDIFIPFYSNFLKIFEASHTIEFLTSLFGSSNTADALQANLFNTLIEIYTLIVSKSETIIHQINDFNGFSIIAYFLDDLPVECLTGELWKFFAVIYSLMDPEQKDLMSSSIIFNLDIWKKADTETQIVVTRDLISIVDRHSEILRHYIGVNGIVKYLESAVETNNDELIGYTVHLLSLSAEMEFDRHEQHVVFLFIYLCKKFSVSVKILRKLSRLHFDLMTNIEWCSLFLHPSEGVRLEWAKIVTNELRERMHENVCLFSLISNTSSSIIDVDDPKTSIIVSCVNTALGLKEETKLEVIKEKGGRIVNFLSLLFAITQIGFSGPLLQGLFNDCMIKFIETKENITLFKNKIDVFALIIFVFYLITIGKPCINAFGVILMDASILQSTIGIIDAIQNTTECNLEEERLAIMESAFQALTSYNEDSSLESYNILVKSILFHPRVTTSEALDRAFKEQSLFPVKEAKKRSIAPATFLYSMVLNFLHTTDSEPVYYFSLAFKNGKWVEETFARKVLFATLAKCKVLNTPILDSVYFILYSFLIIAVSKENINAVIPIISEVYNQTDKESPRFSLILFLLRAFEKGEIASVRALFSKHQSEITSDSINFEANKQVLYYSNNAKPNWVNGVYHSLRKLFKKLMERHVRFSVPLSNEIKSKLDAALSEETPLFSRRQAEHSWRRLWQSMSLTHNPFLTSIGQPHYMRGNVIGTDFCPVLLKKNAEFTIHADASKVPVDESQFLEKLPPHFNFIYEARELKPIKFNEKLAKWREPCDMIKTIGTTKGGFCVYSDSFTFVSDEDSKLTKILFKDVKYVFIMNILQRETAVEIFTHCHKSYFFNFPELKDKTQIIKNISNNYFPNAEFVQTKSGAQEVEALQLTHKWQTHQISTFTYLMWLNQLSGRSFNNMQNYPVFPWILSDYTSKHLNLSNPNSFRDLSKPIGAINEERINKIKGNVFPDENGVPVLYRSTYSCPFHSYYYLIRLEPYTTLHIDIQDGHFDVPGRLFSTISGAWNSAAGVQNNYKELIPEFFFLPDFLVNKDHFKLGVLSSGEEIDDVGLPPWASSPEEFIQLHREALECDYVSQNINKWIDLIWGVNQKGEGSINADNVFDQRLYDNVWDVYPDPDRRPEIEAMLKHVGIIPEQIFYSPHPQRLPVPKRKLELVSKIKYCNDIADITVSNDYVYVLSSNASVYTLNKLNQIVCVSNNKRETEASCAVEDGLFAYISSESHVMSIIGQNGRTSTLENTQHIESITCISSCGKFIFTGGKDGVFAEWSTKRSVMSHSEGIICCAAREEQNIAVSCGVDGVMIIMKANPLKFVKAIHMNLPEDTVPQCISIGASGIIAVVSGHQVGSVRGEYVSLFTINGTKYAEESVGVTAIELITLIDGTVLIAAAVHDHSVLIFNGTTFKLKELLIRCESQITTLHFDTKTQNLYVGTENGTLYTFCLLDK